MFADAVESSVGVSGARRVRMGRRGSRIVSLKHFGVIPPSPSNGLDTVLVVVNICNGITHVWSVCAMELMDSSRKNSISTEEKKKKKGDMEPAGMGWRSALM